MTSLRLQILAEDVSFHMRYCVASMKIVASRDHYLKMRHFHPLQIFANLQKYWNIAMSNDGSSIEMIDQSHGD